MKNKYERGEAFTGFVIGLCLLISFAAGLVKHHDSNDKDLRAPAFNGNELTDEDILTLTEMEMNRPK